MSDVPPLKNGIERVSFDRDESVVSAIVSEDVPFFLFPVDSGLVLDVERRGAGVLIRARRAAPAPTLVWNPCPECGGSGRDGAP